MEEILPLVETYVFVEHSNKPVITISGNDLVTATKEEFEAGIDIFKDLNIHINFYVPTNEVEGDEDDDDDDNNTNELKQARLQYKLNKATLMRK